MPSVADIIKWQTSVARSKPVPKPEPVAPVQLKRFTKKEAMMNFLEDRNYSDDPIKVETAFNQAMINAVLQREQQVEYVHEVQKKRGVDLGSVSMNNIEDASLGNYNYLHNNRR